MHSSETPQLLTPDGSNMTHDDPGWLTMTQDDIPGVRGAPGGSGGRQGAPGGKKSDKNSKKWPQMLQKWKKTILFGSGHTLGTLKHGLESLFYCFITIFGVGSSLAPPGAPLCPPGPPGAPLTPGMSSWTIVSHPESLWVMSDPSVVNNSSVFNKGPPLPPTPKSGGY